MFTDEDDFCRVEQKRQKTALYPGTFDPITLGHVDVITEAARIFEHVEIGILDNPAKTPMFTLEERVGMIKAVIQDLRLEYRVGIATSTLLTVEVAGKLQAGTIVRGVRLNTDFESELFLALNNRALSNNVGTIFVPPRQEHLHISSTAVRELLRFKQDNELSKYLPGSALKLIKDWRKS